MLKYPCLQQLIYDWPIATKFPRKLLAETHPGTAKRTVRSEDRKRGEESGDYALVSDILRVRREEEEEGGTLVQKCRRAVHSAGTFTHQHPGTCK